MSTPAADLLLHPTRLRIVLLLGSERHMTTAAISARLPDIPHATLYRHVATLADSGLLEVVEERRVRGGVERTYMLVPEAVELAPEDVASVGPEGLLRGFVVFAGSLIEAFGRYAADQRARPADDPVSYRQAAVWLDDDERDELVGRLRDAISPFLENTPSAHRRRLLLNTILIPDLSAAPAEGAADNEP